MRILLDSSALAKRYIAEPGSAAVEVLCRTAREIVLSTVTLPETLSALNRLRREGKLADDAYFSLKTEIQEDFTELNVIGLTPSLLLVVIHCLEVSAIRTLDAIHVATAIDADCEIFLSADRRQCQTAGAMGLCVVDLSALK